MQSCFMHLCVTTSISKGIYVQGTIKNLTFHVWKHDHFLVVTAQEYLTAFALIREGTQADAKASLYNQQALRFLTVQLEVGGNKMM